MSKNMSKKKRWLIGLGIFIGFLLILSIGVGSYLSDYYRADGSVVETALQSTDQVTVSKIDKNKIVFSPEHPTAGFIFYPGGKVEYEAYAPLMKKFAENGILCVLVRMPGNLAVLNKNAADGIKENYPEITNWYIGGHSLGGAMAASYVSEHAQEYAGLILLAAYSTSDLTDSGLQVVSVYGSKDEVLKMDSYENYRSNLPSDSIEHVIKGGCHAFFGCYGAQEGDGIPEITNEEQIDQTVDTILKVMIE